MRRKIGVPFEEHAEQVEALALLPVRDGPDVHDSVGIAGSSRGAGST